MNMPNVVSVGIDETKNVRYEVLAYRSLSPGELVQTIRLAVRRMKKKPKKNTTCQIYTSIGDDE